MNTTLSLPARDPERWQTAVTQYQRGTAAKEIAREIGIDYNTLRGIFSRYKVRKGKPTAQAAVLEFPQTYAVPQPDIIQFPTIKAYPLPDPDPEPPLTDDFESFNDDLARLKRDEGMIRMVVRSDTHIPDHDPQAVRCGIEVIRAVKPHIALDAGDTVDFSVLSTYPQSRTDMNKDAFMHARPAYTQRAEATQEAYDKVIQAAMGGNHNIRLLKFADVVHQVGDTLEERYINLMRAGGLVKHLGWREEIDIGFYRPMHGERTSKRAHEDVATKDYDGVQTLSIGHTHRAGMFYNRVYVPGENRYRIVQAVNIGFEGNNPPAYIIKRKQHTKWIQGCLVAYVNLRGDDVHLFPIVYHKRADGVMVAVVPGAAVIEVAPQA